MCRWNLQETADSIDHGRLAIKRYISSLGPDMKHQSLTLYNQEKRSPSASS